MHRRPSPDASAGEIRHGLKPLGKKREFRVASLSKPTPFRGRRRRRPPSFGRKRRITIRALSCGVNFRRCRAGVQNTRSRRGSPSDAQARSITNSAARWAMSSRQFSGDLRCHRLRSTLSRRRSRQRHAERFSRVVERWPIRGLRRANPPQAVLTSASSRTRNLPAGPG